MKTYHIIERPYGIGLETRKGGTLSSIKWFDSEDAAKVEMEDCMKKDAKKKAEKDAGL